MIVQCGGCSASIQITRMQWRKDSVAPCKKCPEGADLIHARAHADTD